MIKFPQNFKLVDITPPQKKGKKDIKGLLYTSKHSP